jgi:hypothetical protein
MGGKTSKKINKKKTTDLSEEEIQLLLRNTHFNRKQIEDWHAGFIVSLFNMVNNKFKQLMIVFYFAF